MKNVAFALVLFLISFTADAIGVVLIGHQTTDNVGVVINVQDTGGIGGGSIPTALDSPLLAGISTAVFDWNGSILSSSGTYQAVMHVASDPSLASVAGDTIIDLIIDTSTSTATATAYSCTDGTITPFIAASSCGGYDFGGNFANESTASWGPGTAFSRTIGGDDFAVGAQRSISAYDFGLIGFIGVDGLSGGDLIMIGNGIPLETPLGEVMTFQVVPVPAAIWLFGSALGLIGWMRRKTN